MQNRLFGIVALMLISFAASGAALAADETPAPGGTAEATAAAPALPLSPLRLASFQVGAAAAIGIGTSGSGATLQWSPYYFFTERFGAKLEVGTTYYRMGFHSPAGREEYNLVLGQVAAMVAFQGTQGFGFELGPELAVMNGKSAMSSSFAIIPRANLLYRFPKVAFIDRVYVSTGMLLLWSAGLGMTF